MTDPILRGVLDLAIRAEAEERFNLADALFAVAGRMNRNSGGDGYDVQPEPSEEEMEILNYPGFEPDHVAAIRGRQRAGRAAEGATPNHVRGEC